MEHPSVPQRREVRAAVLVNAVLSVVFLAASLVLIFVVRSSLRQEALREAGERAEILLDRNLATHMYFSHQLKPAVFALTDSTRPPGYFEPRWMSSTYAVREIDREFRSLAKGDFYYKECAVNARSPQNEADPFERGFIERLNREPGLERISTVRRLDGEPFLAVMRRGEVMEEACLRCHDTIGRAPAGLLDQYGTERSFHRAVGEVVSAVSIRIPLAEAYAGADRVVARLATVLVASLLALLVTQVFVGRRLVFDPLERLRAKVLELATDEARPGEEVEPWAGREIADLNHAFIRMSANLRREREGLERAVDDRTVELTRANLELKAALADVKRLSGLLPICASCKKIRDQQGSWRPIESYLSAHSEAVLSHGLCPDCVPLFLPGAGKKPPA